MTADEITLVLAVVAFGGLLIVVLALYILAFTLSARVSRLRERVAELEEKQPLVVEVRRCRDCGATDDVVIMAGCWWIEDDLCSSCADDFAAHWAEDPLAVASARVVVHVRNAFGPAVDRLTAALQGRER